MPVAASWKSILLLVGGIKTNLADIKNQNDTLEEQLNKLGTTFQDEGVEIIRAHISRTKRQIEDAIPEFQTILTKMTEYAYLLKKAEDATSYQNERTR